MSKRSVTYKKRQEMAAMAREAKRRTKDVEQPGEAVTGQHHHHHHHIEITVSCYSL